MHQVAEYGIAAHWRYKEGSKAEREYDAKLAWLRQLMDWQRDVSDATEFVEGVKLDIFQDQVFVFTPKGEIKDLPAGATPLDFAYRIHTDVGHRTIGAKVNSRLVPLDYRLKNGDIVEIVTTQAGARAVARLAEPRPDAATRGRRSGNGSSARSATRTSSTDASRSTASCGGSRAPRRRLSGRTGSWRSRGSSTSTRSTTSSRRVGYGAVERRSRSSCGSASSTTRRRRLPTVAPPPSPQRAGGVRVKGVGDLLVRFARCCHPIPGDPIQGFITRGKGVTVHLRTCPTVINEREVSRLIDVEWEAAPTQTYPIAVRVEAYDRTGLLSDITQVVAEAKVNILAADVAVGPDHTAVVRATLEVASVSQLARVLARIEQLKDVVSVQRDLG